MHFSGRMTKRQGFVVLVLLTILGVGVADSRFLWTGWSPDTGGMCFVSQRYGANANSTYSVVFFGVNFTFLYWTYPPPLKGPNGTIIVVLDAPYQAFFIVTFGDGSKENLSFSVDGYAGLMLFQIPRGVKTVHSWPSAGIVTGESLGLWGGWQYTVNLYN